MYVQSQIHSRLSSEQGMAQVQALLSSDAFESRTAVGRAVCDLFGFVDARGERQQAGCLKSLRRLEQSGAVSLPAARGGGSCGQVRTLGEAVALPQGVPARADQIVRLRLTPVCDEHQRRLWNELMQCEHPRGAVIHAGCQMRYIIESEHGVLGGFGFAASALTLAARDRWMGWSAGQRGLHLHRVVGLSRFLIRPGVRCRNLASRALGLVLRRVGDDFAVRYGYRPYLAETFVDPSRHDGASLRASNWILVGETAGRGRQSAPGAEVAVKSVYVYELERGWRELLGIADPARIEVRGAAEGLDGEQWTEQEFGQARLGDRRLSRRLVKSAAVQASAPMASFPAAALGDKAQVYGHYRLIDQPADSEVTPENILAPHRERTLERMQGCAEVLVVQDGTDLNFAEHGGCQGLGLISRNKASMGTLGIHMHSQLVLDEAGVALGVPHIQYDSLSSDDGSDAKRNKMERRWLAGVVESSRMAAQLDGVRVVSVSDREGDFFEFFTTVRGLGNVEAVVRAKHDRVLESRQVQCDGRWQRHSVKLFDRVRSAPVGGGLEIHIGHQSARRATRSHKAKKRKKRRTAQAELRWLAVELPVPGKARHLRGEAPVKLNAVHVLEPEPPAGEEPLEWLLLTTLPVDSLEQAERVIERYRLRWRIEDWHRVLKQGCKVEYLAHQSGERLERAVTIKAVIAWRLAAMVLLGRETPELPPEVLFSDIEVAVLKDFATDRRLPEPDNLGSAVCTMAVMGGYLNRRGDPPPGYKIIWEGYTRLSISAQAYELLLRRGSEGAIYRLLRPDKSCV